MNFIKKLFCSKKINIKAEQDLTSNLEKMAENDSSLSSELKDLADKIKEMEINPEKAKEFYQEDSLDNDTAKEVIKNDHTEKDTPLEIRITQAIEYLFRDDKNIPYLIDVAKETDSWKIRKQIIKNLFEEKDIIKVLNFVLSEKKFDAASLMLIEDAIERITDQKKLFHIFRTNNNYDIRECVLKYIKDQKVLGKIAHDNRYSDLHYLVIQKLDSSIHKKFLDELEKKEKESSITARDMLIRTTNNRDTFVELCHSLTMPEILSLQNCFREKMKKNEVNNVIKSNVIADLFNLPTKTPDEVNTLMNERNNKVAGDYGCSYENGGNSEEMANVILTDNVRTSENVVYYKEKDNIAWFYVVEADEETHKRGKIIYRTGNDDFIMAAFKE
jgi:hypothetical protein